MITSAVDPIAALSAQSQKSAAGAKSGADVEATSDRFLKLLVTQLQNQDPLNPMDNAQVTSQMAQISTVTGIDKLNSTMASFNGQMLQMQSLQGASLVGRAVTLEGNRLDIVDGTAVGGFDIASAADAVDIEILDGAGRTVDTLQLGAASAGRNGFVWDAGDVAADAGYRFRVKAAAGGTALDATPLMRDRVNAVSIVGDALELQTDWSGGVAYRDVVAVN